MSKGNEKGQLCNHIMIDIETMATTQGAAIVSIGAVRFDLERRIKYGGEFYRELAWKKQNREICKKTVEWWKLQILDNTEMKQVLCGTDNLDEVLPELSSFISEYSRSSGAHIWSNGPSFDIAILEHAYNEAMVEPAWEYWKLMDCRTARYLCNDKRGGWQARQRIAHNAISDCKQQISELLNCHRVLME